MRVITDLHIHSKHSRSCSKELTLENIAKWCEIKGIDVVGTGDFTFPAWISDIEEKLEECADGVFALRGGVSKTRFILTTEISSIYKQGDKVRRIHLVLALPSIKAVRKFISLLDNRGANLKSDGRPILGITAPDIVKMILLADPQGLVIPAHAWTPHFAVFGSGSGFDSLEECFGEEAKHIYAIETGLSSDPAMNWRLSALDNIMLVSNSDAHSLRNLGREANVFDVDNFDYKNFFEILQTRDRARFIHTIEFYPEEGKYHFDGHRECSVRLSPEESKKLDGLCPKCKKRMTLGVMHRIDSLADRPAGFVPKEYTAFRSIVPLEIIISEALGKGIASKLVQTTYQKIVSELAPEFEVLLDRSYDELGSVMPKKVVEAVRRVREGRLLIRPGYDGVYGSVKIFASDEDAVPKQRSLI